MDNDQVLTDDFDKANAINIFFRYQTIIDVDSESTNLEYKILSETLDYISLITSDVKD